MEDDNAAITVSAPVLKGNIYPQDWTKWLTLAKASFMFDGAVGFLSETPNAAKDNALDNIPSLDRNQNSPITVRSRN